MRISINFMMSEKISYKAKNLLKYFIKLKTYFLKNISSFQKKTRPVISELGHTEIDEGERLHHRRRLSITITMIPNFEDVTILHFPLFVISSHFYHNDHDSQFFLFANSGTNIKRQTMMILFSNLLL
jgi:hypothetical protein